VLFYENEHVNLLIEKIRYQVYTTYFINQLTKPFFICLLFSEDILFSLCNRWGCRVLKKRHVVHINCQVSKLFRIGANYFCSFLFALGVYLLNFCFFSFCSLTTVRHRIDQSFWHCLSVRVNDQKLDIDMDAQVFIADYRVCVVKGNQFPYAKLF